MFGKIYNSGNSHWSINCLVRLAIEELTKTPHDWPSASVGIITVFVRAMNAGDVRLSTRDATSFNSFVPIHAICVVQEYEFKALLSWKENMTFRSLSYMELHWNNMMASSNGNIFRVTGPLCGKFTGHRWIPLTKAGDAELWCILWSAPEQTVEQIIPTLVIWDAIVIIMTSL